MFPVFKQSTDILSDKKGIENTDYGNRQGVFLIVTQTLKCCLQKNLTKRIRVSVKSNEESQKDMLPKTVDHCSKGDISTFF